jgi:hypothetical protein
MNELGVDFGDFADQAKVNRRLFFLYLDQVTVFPGDADGFSA